MSESNTDWLAKKHFDELSLQLRSVWDLYLKFYTVFLTFNILALAAVVQHIARDNRTIIVVALVLQNLLSGITAVCIGCFSKDSARRLEDVTLYLLREAPENSQRPPFSNHSPIPGRLGFWSGVANAVSHLTLIGCWIAVLLM